MAPHPSQPGPAPTESQRVLRPEGVTQLDFRRLELGGTSPGDTTLYPKTSYAQAAARMGEGYLLEVSPGGRTCRYQWNGGGRWARLEATFRDGYLGGKSQFLLSKNQGVSTIRATCGWRRA